ncbi:cuticle protein 7 [Malaya genurostris]|uniref:cuticle protein 7 n=1 Tax=Malaya genurostris TaxID=325434 RepID=UPI0026F3F958|nr:cuticle protein 7 [Malaya genurostris]XP_058464435.1 cuticle protein 7 [Malaya genurostris]
MHIPILLFAVVLLTTEIFCAHLVEFVSNYRTDSQINYSFRYYIDHPQSGVSLDHWEDRRGDYVHGGYGVLDPGGYVRTVHYEVEGGSGFRTVIKTTAPGSSSQYNIYSGKRAQPAQPVWNTQPVAFVHNGNKS